MRASQVKKLVYVIDPASNMWSIVVSGKRSILGVGDVEDDEQYDAFEDTPPFTITNSDVTDVESATSYMCAYHGEEIMVETSNEGGKSKQ